VVVLDNLGVDKQPEVCAIMTTVSRPAARLMRVVSELKGTVTPANGSAATIVRSGGVLTEASIE
jgi:hypothetical protein